MKPIENIVIKKFDTGSLIENMPYVLEERW